MRLEDLQRSSVFQATPPAVDLGPLHVPFDELMGTTATEGALAGAVERGEPAALIGKSGSGKSSSIAHVLSPAMVSIAPIVVPVAAVPETVETPASLVAYLIGTVKRAAEAASIPVDTDAVDATNTTSTTATRGARLAPSFRWLKGDLAKEVTSQTTIERKATFADKEDVLVASLETIKDHGLKPNLVFDDTDRWLGPNASKLATAFFGETARWMVERLRCGIVVAVHPSYFEMVSRPQLLQYFDTQIEVPVLDRRQAIEAILARRIEQYAEVSNPRIRDFIDEDASDALLAIYQETGSMRRSLQVCHGALHDAVAGGASTISAGHIIAASNAG